MTAIVTVMKDDNSPHRVEVIVMSADDAVHSFELSEKGESCTIAVFGNQHLVVKEIEEG